MNTAKPVAGQPVLYKGRLVGHVKRVEGNLCWLNPVEGCSLYDSGGRRGAAPFIWRFHDGLNTLHTWGRLEGK